MELIEWALIEAQLRIQSKQVLKQPTFLFIVTAEQTRFAGTGQVAQQLRNGRTDIGAHDKRAAGLSINGHIRSTGLGQVEMRDRDPLPFQPGAGAKLDFMRFNKAFDSATFSFNETLHALRSVIAVHGVCDRKRVRMSRLARQRTKP